MDALLLARIKFAVTIGFHFIFPPISIGLAWLVVVTEWFGWRKHDAAWVQAGKLFGKLLAITFAVGVATGIVMEFQFGTNWARYSKFVGDIFGAPLAAEGIFSFFLESAFMGLYLFGRGRVSERLHWFSALMVAVGATLSAFWIIVANSWQQTPAGYVVRNGRA
jgi:cytochrome bd ubiquinol oxidase subunit I